MLINIKIDDCLIVIILLGMDQVPLPLSRPLEGPESQNLEKHQPLAAEEEVSPSVMVRSLVLGSFVHLQQSNHRTPC